MLAWVILYGIIFLYGIVLGSFSNVLICRLPIKENIVTHRSHCMTCGRQIQWYDLVPLVSYLFLRGKCRYCKAKISMQYPLVEAVNGFGYVLIFAIRGLTWNSILDCLLFTILVALAIVDWRTYEIPIGMNAAIGVLGVLKIIWNPSNLFTHVIGFCVISGFMLICLFVGRMAAGVDAFGGGDIKLMAVAGLYLGWQNIILAFVIGCILGAMVHPLMMKARKKGSVLAFGPYLAVGIMIAVLWGEALIGWYLGLIGL